MSNYPPGMSKRDFIRAGIDQPHHHEHEWRPADYDEEFIIEDGAAIFFQKCNYAEGRYGEGWSCDETRSYRFEYDVLIAPDGEEVPLPDITEWEVGETVNEKVEHYVEVVETSDYDIVDVDPDPDDGTVTIEYDGYKIRYSA